MSKPVPDSPAAVPHISHAKEALELWTSEYPDRIGSIGTDGEGLTWREISASTRTLTGRLERAGAGAGDRVAVMAGRSRYALSSLLAIWANGSSAVLLDERHPIERLRWIVADARCKVLVSSEPEAAELGLTLIETHGSETDSAGLPPNGFDWDEWADIQRQPEAYVVYTSGTTGRPKGVRVGSAALGNLLANAESLGYRPGSRAVSVVSPGFDGWLWSILTPFVNGVTCVALDPALGDLEQALAAREIDHLCMTPSLYATLTELPKAEVAVVAGERCPDSLADRLRTMADRVINVYGPTETTIAATMADTAHGDDPRTIGRPLSGYTVTVVGAGLNEVPPGVTGEVLIGGVGVALGYVDTSGPGAERFIDRNGARYFRTGDLGVLRADGQLSILGRADNQVKIGGFRIELEELENIACEVPGVEGAVAYTRGEPPTLAIGLQTASGRPLDDDLRTRLTSEFAARLPRQLRPTLMHRIADIPLEPTGKAARREVAALGDAELARQLSDADADDAGPARDDHVLDRVLEVWRGAFGHAVAQDSDFFAIGGHSLLAAQLASRMETELGVTVSINDVLTARTPGALARRIDEARAA
ncbi:non-ribosomal peptide synthetase [Streptomyces sp. NPDC002589]|uniref:non-ribosomal peptide synthetase n=1 Tax=Streptomyces sp. NPDC002589 TaxID=3154420 RepID=UPI003329E6DA